MEKIGLSMAKAHLRAAEGTEEDELIEAWTNAAYLAVEGKVFRKVYADAVPAADPAGVVANEAINAAVLLIVGHLYANREAVVQGQAVEVPMGAEWLLAPYVNYAGGA